MALWDTDNVPPPPAPWQTLVTAAVTAENKILVLLDKTSFAAHLATKNKPVHVLSAHISGLTSQIFPDTSEGVRWRRAATENVPVW